MNIDEAVGIAFKTIGLKEVHVKELSEHIKTFITGFKDDDIESIKSKVNGYLSRNVKSKTAIYAKSINPKTKRSKKGFYGLAKPKKTTPIIKVDGQRSLFPVEKTQKAQNGVIPAIQNGTNPAPLTNTESLYFGKGGEYAVASELLFRGYNASIMSVDEGIDITASKNDKFFYIQVKSTSFHNNAIRVTLKPNNFIKGATTTVFYIIVFRYMFDKANINRYFIFPQHDMDRFLTVGLVSQTISGTQIKIKQDKDELFIYNGSKSESIAGYYLDNFGLLK